MYWEYMEIARRHYREDDRRSLDTMEEESLHELAKTIKEDRVQAERLRVATEQWKKDQERKKTEKEERRKKKKVKR